MTRTYNSPHIIASRLVPSARSIRCSQCVGRTFVGVPALAGGGHQYAIRAAL